MRSGGNKTGKTYKDEGQTEESGVYTHNMAGCFRRFLSRIVINVLQLSRVTEESGGTGRQSI